MLQGFDSNLRSFLNTQQPNWPARRYWLLALVCAGIFGLLMPREEAFPYSFQQGQPWSYRTLNAPFDYEVLYPEEEVRSELERVNAEHAPYFRLYQDMARQQKKRFSKLVEDQIQISRHDTQFEDLVRNPTPYLTFGQQLLDMIYRQGIVNPSEEAFKDTPGFIYIVSGNMERKIPVQEVGTISRALDFLTDTLPFGPLRQPELILPMLEKSLAINVQYSDSLTVVQKRRKLAAVTGTGIMVHKGEQIIQAGEIVTEEVEQKLKSLQRRYHSEEGPYAAAGTAILALLAFVTLLWTTRMGPAAFPFIALLTLLISLGAGWLGRVGEAVPLLLPLWALPLVFRKTGEHSYTGRLVWMAVLFLTTISFNWAAGWMTIQVAGFSAALFFLEQRTWKERTLATVGIWIVQCTALAGLSLAGHLPDTMHWTDASVFLLLGTVISFTLYPLRRMLRKRVALQQLEAEK